MGWQLRVQGGTPPWTGCSSTAGPLTHTQSDWDNVDTPVYFMCISLGCGRKPAYPEKTHTYKERMSKFHTDSGPRQKLIFFSS